MCGINGFTFQDKDLIKKMMVFTKNRGPDANGIFYDSDLTMSHDRLSIIDLNSRANQPMKFKNYVISFNGEIYNYRELKKNLEQSGSKFSTNSDTEVILQLFEKYKLNAFEKLSGIFAISIWDTKEKKLYLVRDTIGVKPLYYYQKKTKNMFYFSSSIKSILLSVDKKEINHNALNFYCNFGRNDDVETTFKGIYKLLPGEIIIWKNNNIEKKKILQLKKSNKIFENKKLKQLIEESVSSQLVSDVPLALSLSGGVDSNIVYSVMRKKINNFNIYSFYFKDYEKFNEDFKIAKLNSDFYKNNFVPIEIGFNDYIDNSEKVVDILEEPSGNHCSILNYAMSKQIKEKILLTGDGGDESFTGYDRYKSIHIINFLKNFNLFKFLNINTKYKNINRFFYQNPKDMFLSFSEQNIYKNPNKYFQNFKYISKENLYLNHSNNFNLEDNLNSVSLIDLDTIVPNEYLLRNDKIFMNEGIEVRVPLLDLKIVSNFMSINEYKKFQYSFESKGLVKKLFKNEIYKLVNKKWGLQSPYAKWMKGPLQNFLKSILSEHYYSGSKNYINFDNVNKMIKLHKEKYYNPDLLWSIAMFQIFLRNFKL